MPFTPAGGGARMRIAKFLGMVWMMAGCGSPAEVVSTSAADREAPAFAVKAPICVAGATETCGGPDGCDGVRRCADDGAAMDSCYCQRDCAPAARSIYVIGENRRLYRFEASTASLHLVGALSCSLAPVSMAVDRQGVAWVLSDEGLLFRVSTTDASCSPTDFAPGQSTFFKFGMGFATDTPGGQSETLYIGGDGTFGRIDLSSFRASLVGQWRLGASELSGTADARMFAFTRGETTSFSEIEPHSGAVMSESVVGEVEIRHSYAVASSGGAFWLFADARAYSYETATRKATLANEDLGVSVVGAGSSTCAAVD